MRLPVPRVLVRTAPGLLVTVATATASAQCRTIDFEGLPPGTVVTDQYAGVTFVVFPESCGPGDPAAMIVDVGSDAASETQALQVGFGCPDFGSDRLDIVFDELQRAVSFTVGGSVPGRSSSRP